MQGETVFSLDLLHINGDIPEPVTGFLFVDVDGTIDPDLGWEAATPNADSAGHVQYFSYIFSYSSPNLQGPVFQVQHVYKDRRCDIVSGVPCTEGTTIHD